MPISDRPLRVLYAAGPGDVIGTYRHWREGRDDLNEVAVTYSGQFFETCRRHGFAGKAVAMRGPAASVKGDGMVVEHRPLPFRGGRLHNVGKAWYTLRLIGEAMRFRADVVVVSAGSHWAGLRLLPRLGVQVVPTLHCVLWPKYVPPRRLSRWLLRLGSRLFSREASAILSLSEDITRQVRELTGGQTRPIIPFLPTYRRDRIAPTDPPARKPGDPFRVLYAGRIEASKGVFLLLEAARQFRDAGRSDIVFELCGSGGALEALRAQAAEEHLSEMFVCRGHLDQSAMRQAFTRCHVVVVPTTTAFIEGMNKVVVEAVLAGRPVVTSAVCPALEYVAEAAIEVPPDDVAAYAQAIRRLCDDPQLYEAKRAACAAHREPFLDPAMSWGSALEQVLLAVREGMEIDAPRHPDREDAQASTPVLAARESV